jgi:hypothetical protein
MSSCLTSDSRDACAAPRLDAQRGNQHSNMGDQGIVRGEASVCCPRSLDMWSGEWWFCHQGTAQVRLYDSTRRFPAKKAERILPRVSSTTSPHVRGILSNGPDSPYFPPSCRSAHGPAATTAIRYLPVPAAKARQDSSGCRSSSSR